MELKKKNTDRPDPRSRSLKCPSLQLTMTSTWRGLGSIAYIEKNSASTGEEEGYSMSKVPQWYEFFPNISKFSEHQHLFTNLPWFLMC